MLMSPASKSDRIFRDEAAPGRIVVAVAVVQESGTVVLTPGELEGVVGGGPGHLRGPIWIVSVAGLHRARIRQRRGAPERIGQEGRTAVREAFVDVEANQQIGARAAALLLLHHVPAIVAV